MPQHYVRKFIVVPEYPEALILSILFFLKLLPQAIVPDLERDLKPGGDFFLTYDFAVL